MSGISSLDHAWKGNWQTTGAWLVALDQAAVVATLISAGLAVMLFVAHLAVRNDVLRGAGNIAMGAGCLASLAALVSRYAYMVRIDPMFFPLSNLFESIMFLVFCIFVVYLAADRLFRAPGFGLASSSLVFLGMGLASLLPARLRDAHPLVPALQSYWLKIHVTLMLLSYAAFLLASLAAATYLFFHLRDRFLSPKAVGAAAATNAKAPITTLETLDELAYRLILVGFPLLALGIITGGLWANHAWGSYWSWDPKETWALITWLVYAAYLHARITRDWRGSRAAWFAVAGFGSVLITYLGVNYLAQGLHTYGSLL